MRLPGPSVHDNDDVGFHTLLEHFSLVGSQLERLTQGCACGCSGAIIMHWRIHSRMRRITKYDAGMSVAALVAVDVELLKVADLSCANQVRWSVLGSRTTLPCPTKRSALRVWILASPSDTNQRSNNWGISGHHFRKCYISGFMPLLITPHLPSEALGQSVLARSRIVVHDP